jgi:NAD(P)-dependent dehydrogenase (short-subunit alcohol dehydrogenase family)
VKQPGYNRSILVTGCSSGFGKLIARTMGRCGYRVYAGMRSIHERNAEAARELSDWAVAQNAAIDIVELDVDSEESVNGAVRAIRDAGGEIDVVVNNAAITAWGPTEAFDFEQLTSVYNTNVFGPWRVNKAVLPQMRVRRSGLIIHVTSVVGRVLRTGALYAASKWAAEGLAESMAHEVRRFGIDVVLLEPGAYPTPWVGRGITPADKQIVAEYEKAAAPPPQTVKPGPDYRYPDPQEVADEVRRLVELPGGQRPLRSVVGHIFTEGVAEYNEAYEKMRRQLIEALARPDQAIPWV